MRWRKFSEKKPKENSEIIIRSFPWKTFKTTERITFSNNTLWMGGNLALCQEHYEWLDEESDECPCCGRTK